MAEKKIVELKQTAERIVQILDDVDQTYAETRSNAQDAKTTVTSLQQTMTDLTEQVGEQGSVLEGHKSDIATLKEIAAEYSLTYADDLLSLIKEKDGVSEVVGSPIKIVSAVETVSSVITVTRITPASNTVTLEEPGVIEYRVESLQDGVETGDITVTWKVNNVTVLTETVKQGVNTFKLDGRVAAGNNGITATFKDSIGTTYTSRWSVDVIDMYITSTFNDTVTYIGNANVSFTAFGALKKTIYFLLDGEEIYQTDITASGVQSSYIIPHQEHGAHSLEIYCKATMNNGREIESTHLYYDIMFVDEGNNTPIIRWPYDNASLTQFTATTFKYSVYTPNSLTTDIELYVGDDRVASLNVDRNQKEWVYKPQTVGENITFMIKAGDVEKVKVLNVAAFPYDVTPVDGYTIDFNPTGRTNNDTDYDVWEYKDKDGNVLYSMSVSEGFDWNNGGWRVDEKGDSYFCVKAGSRMYLNYPLFEPLEDTKLNGKNFKFIFKTTNNRAIADTAISCMASKEIEGKLTSVGVDIGTQLAVLHMGTSEIDVQYVEDQKLELEFNIQEQTDEKLDNRKSLVTLLINADPSKAALYDGNASFNLSDFGTNVPVTVGSDSCDVHLYRFKCYEQELSDKAIMQNYIADATNSDDMISRYERNDILDDSGENLDYNKLLKLCPDLRIILLTCPRFTFDKDDKVEGCTVQHLMGNGRPEDNWIAENVRIKGQGTSSNEYGTSARNLDFKMNKYKDGTLVQDTNDDGTPKVDEEGKPVYKELEFAFKFENDERSTKYAMTENSVPVNYFNLKVNVASSESANNARLAQRFFEFNPYKRPVRDINPKVRDTMEFHPCVIFIKELGDDVTYGNQEFPDDDKFHFYACGDFGNSKKNHEAFGMDLASYDDYIKAAKKQNTATPVDGDGNPMRIPTEAILEISNNTSPGCLFKYTPGWGDDILPDEDPAPTMDDKGNLVYVDIWGGDVVEHRYPEDLFDIIKNKEGKYTDVQVQAAKNIFASLKNDVRRLWYWVASTDTTTVKDEPDTLESLGIAEDKRYGFTHDNVEYRKAKFKNEYTQYFEPKSLLYNYLFTDRYLMVDNRAKNVFLHTVDGLIWDLCFDYDNDTSLGCDNVGGLKFEYYYEDTDTVNGEKVFNASTSVLWTNVRDCLYSELTSLYQEGSWATAKGLTEDFEKYQSIKPERLHMFDMRRKYIRPYTEGHYGSNIKDGKVNSYTRYLSMLNGRKTYQRAAFEKYREAYINSKYQKASDSEAFIFRSVTKNPEQPMTLTPYCWLYVQVNFDGAKTPAIKTPAGQPVTLTVPAAQGLLEDKNVRIYHPRWLSGVDGLDQFYIREANFDYGIKLSKLILGSEAEGYTNEKESISLAIGGATLLEELNICGWSSPKAWSINLSGNVGLKKFYATNTNMSSVDFAKGGLLEEAKINAVSALSTINLNNVHTFELESSANITKARFENTSFTTAASFVSQCTNLARARIIGVDWTLSSNQLLNKLVKMSGIDENGFDISQSVVAGKVYVPEIRQSEIDAYANAWPNLEVTYSELIPQYDVVFKDWDGTVLATTKVDLGGYVQDPVESGLLPENPSKDATISTSYEFSHWDGLDMSVPVNTNRTYTAVYTETTRTYNVSWYTDNSEETLIESVDVEYGSDVSLSDMSKIQPQYSPSFNAYNLFRGWDKSTSYIQGDIKVHALWENGFVNLGEEVITTDLTAAQIYTLISNGNIQGIFTDDGMTPQGDRIKIKMGYQPEFTNIPTRKFISESTYFNGTTYIDTGVALFEEDKDWTLVIDGQFNEGNNEKAALVSCYRSQDSSGVQFNYSNGGPKAVWGGGSAGTTG